MWQVYEQAPVRYNTHVSKITNWLEIDSDALQHNAQVIRRYLGKMRALWAVVKADAYGHGATRVVNALLQAGVSHFVVASLGEAIALREALPDQPFRLMTLYPPITCDAWRAAAQYRVESVVESIEGYHQACAVAQSLECAMPVHLEIDTGMSRLGLTPTQIEPFLTEFNPDAPLAWQSVFTHFACAGSDPELTLDQLRLFQQLVARLRVGGFPQTPLHAAASAGILTMPESLLDAARVGLLLYGIAPERLESHPLCAQLRPVLSWRATVISVREIAQGQCVSYGACWRARHPTRIATLGVGYADGYPIGLTNRAPIALHGKLVPQVGRVCMDMLMVDTTDVPEVQVGDVATLIGHDEGAEVRVETLAQILHTTPHELTTRLRQRAKSV
ncbi:MAG: hypothetical protein KatS3mg017_0565 [Fimbriimonadales bacterium]|nr:MAG: hypothetical protein KatS3mg017_0565 [Fimbriimonadales bacterium]